MLGVGRLGQEVISTHAHGLNGFVNTAVACGHNDRYREPASLHLLDQFHAVEFGHSEVGDHDAVGTLNEQRQRLVSIASEVYLDAEGQLE